jgi:hypothetical protein
MIETLHKLCANLEGRLNYIEPYRENHSVKFHMQYYKVIKISIEHQLTARIIVDGETIYMNSCVTFDESLIEIKKAELAEKVLLEVFCVGVMSSKRAINQFKTI